MSDILQKVQVNMPYQMLIDHYLPLVVERKINPEIGFNCFVLDRFGREDFSETARKLGDAGLSITFHAPFFDLRPGALDRRIREVTKDRLNQVFDLVPLFKPKTIVCHASFDRRYYVTHEDDWLENSRDTWSGFLSLAEEMGTTIALENVYEENPAYLGKLLGTFSESAHLFCCFDTGHFNAFSDTPLNLWMDELAPHIGQVHLHDNGGHGDDHAAVGDGTFPFHDFFKRLRKDGTSPIITLEPHTEETLWKTVHNIDTMKLFEFLE